MAEIIAEFDDNDFFLMMNSSTKDVTVVLPSPGAEKKWFRCVDTSVPSPNDFLMENEEETLEEQGIYVLPSRSFAILISK
jgi:glycogen operon protein